jgi:hypothetical protein
VALDLRERLSAAVFFYTILVPSEYDSVFEQDGKTRDLVTSITDELIADSMRRTNRVENERPYLGEVLWSLFFIYRAFLGRLAVLIVMGKRRCHIDNWRDDPGVHQILGGVFKEKELEVLLGSKEDLHAVYRVLDRLQSLILEEISRVSSGE